MVAPMVHQVGTQLSLRASSSLSKKEKSFFLFFATYLKSTSIFEHFETKDDPDTLCISEIIDCERRVS